MDAHDGGDLKMRTAFQQARGAIREEDGLDTGADGIPGSK